MKLEKIYTEAIEHYERMIQFAKNQIKKGFVGVDTIKMEKIIQDAPFSSHCPYCQAYNIICNKCQLQDNKYENRKLILHHPENCCDGLYDKLSEAGTWDEWITAAENILEYIKKYGLTKK